MIKRPLIKSVENFLLLPQCPSCPNCSFHFWDGACSLFNLLLPPFYFFSMLPAPFSSCSVLSYSIFVLLLLELLFVCSLLLLPILGFDPCSFVPKRVCFLLRDNPNRGSIKEWTFRYHRQIWSESVYGPKLDFHVTLSSFFLQEGL